MSEKAFRVPPLSTKKEVESFCFQGNKLNKKTFLPGWKIVGGMADDCHSIGRRLSVIRLTIVGHTAYDFRDPSAKNPDGKAPDPTWAEAISFQESNSFSIANRGTPRSYLVDWGTEPSRDDFVPIS